MNNWRKVLSFGNVIYPEFQNFERAMELMEEAQLRDDELFELSKQLNTMGFNTYIGGGGRAYEPMLVFKSVTTEWPIELLNTIEQLGFRTGAKIISKRVGGYQVKHYIFKGHDIRQQLMKEKSFERKHIL